MRVEGSPAAGDSTQVITESQNISASGVYCTSTHYLAPLSRVALTIVLPRLPGSTSSKELIKCDGIVVRCEPARARRSEKNYELACMFSDLDDQRRMLLDEFVTWRNLQSLRAATAGPNGVRPGAKTAGAARQRTVRKSAARRRTIH
ncbi:MAG: PilZ domain-containing protein [Candidatus Eisenbacteria bacterium]|nr:PilZ domain-containing protein [Candidatus Eisenbacteria bacterium]